MTHFIEIISTGQTRKLRLAEFRSMPRGSYLEDSKPSVSAAKATCLWPLVHFVQIFRHV